MPSNNVNLITGATGQLGSHIVEQLRLAGETVRVLVRPGRDQAFLQQQGVEIVEGDLRDADTVKRATQGATIVYHCAAKVSDWGAWREFEEEAVTATRNVVEACRAANVQRLLHVSSISVYGHPKPSPSAPLPGGDGRITEDTPLGQGFWLWDYYPRAKLLAEQIAREFPATTVVRPSWLYGPRDRITIPRSHPGPLEQAGADHRIGGKLSQHHLRRRCGARRDPGGESSECRGAGVQPVQRRRGEAGRSRQHVNRCVSLPRVTKHVPYGLAIRFAFVQECWKRLIGSATPPRITRRAIYLIGRSTAYSTEKAEKELGWKRQIDIHDGIKQTLEWFVSLPENRHLAIKSPVLPV